MDSRLQSTTRSITSETSQLEHSMGSIANESSARIVNTLTLLA